MQALALGIIAYIEWDGPKLIGLDNPYLIGSLSFTTQPAGPNSIIIRIHCFMHKISEFNSY